MAKKSTIAFPQLIYVRNLFTVVKNVKQAHECLEHGETQEFQDDIEYILPGLKDSQPVPTRCLSTMSLATKCNVPAFRMHLRAHGVIMEILGILHDAAAHAPLALCVSALLFMNSRDRLVMDLERPALTLMLSLLSADSNRSFDSTDSEMEKMRLKVSTMLEAFRKEGNVKNFILEEISTGFLAMETLLSLTSKKAGDWFKEELRTLGGLDHIVNTVNASVEDFDEFSIDPSPTMLDRCRKLNRCLRVLENVTYLNSDNQTYLMTYKSAVLVKSLYKAIKSCENCLPFNEVGCVGDKLDEGCHGFVLYSCLLANLRVLLNLTHENMVGATRVGQMSGFIPTLLSTILRLPQFIPSNHRFDLLVLGLGLLINLVEECDHNQRMLLDATTDTPFEHSVKRKVDPLEAFALLFNLRLEAAKKFEVEHDRELDEKKKRKEEKRSYGSNQKMNVRKSGQWKESDSGLEWIVNPGDEEEAAEDGEEKEDREEEEERGLEDDPLVPSSQEEQEDLTKALHKAGKHMEDSIIAAYVSLLVGCLIQHNSHLAEKVRGSLPEESFDSMIRMLKKFLGFMNFTSATTGNTGSKSIMRVIGILDASNC
ncbi:hypothetical protein CAPTEDRAFT_225551 [Capitella teleta]|uniref:WAPL domain-containing protein n=1 Tax=Capitella teleta TaxID=283909 RepID=R7U1R9_CAPTE|nr:hypothetical protein CAPTEDRAFT_225551 [Capitella teleta]|eukprot:ELT99924.1 hypothetical protein CAPTEDRAFT_225551 [Capitella teleta]